MGIKLGGVTRWLTKGRRELYGHGEVATSALSYSTENQDLGSGWRARDMVTCSPGKWKLRKNEIRDSDLVMHRNHQP